jgi:hypothetical protein
LFVATRAALPSAPPLPFAALRFGIVAAGFGWVLWQTNGSTAAVYSASVRDCSAWSSC